MKLQELANWVRMAKRKIIEHTINRFTRWIDRAIAYLDRAPKLRVIPSWP